MADSLPTTRLGRTDLDLPRVGFGAWAIGGGGWTFAWGSQDDPQSIGAIRKAVESGVNWIDTAAVYGLGHSEEVVATALAGLPEADRPYVFTKGGLVSDPGDRSAPPRPGGAGWPGSPCPSCTGPPQTAPESRSTGRPSLTSSAKARSAPSGCPTTTWPSWTRPRASRTWTPSSRRSA